MAPFSFCGKVHMVATFDEGKVGAYSVAYRLPMRLPWRLDHHGVVRVNLEPFDRSPDEIPQTFLPVWRYCRS
jgi:hypothetical protein